MVINCPTGQKKINSRDQFTGLAQLVERLTSNREVAGSNPHLVIFRNFQSSIRQSPPLPRVVNPAVVSAEPMTVRTWIHFAPNVTGVSLPRRIIAAGLGGWEILWCIVTVICNLISDPCT